MADESTTIAQLVERMKGFVDERDWQQFHSPKNLAMGMAIETAELMEHFQWVDNKASRDMRHDPEMMALIKEELSDVLSYCLAMASEMDIDLSDAYFEKMKANEKKYPPEKWRGRFK